jgi:branched-chain amino acid transport system substrate-binding protein
VIATAVGGDDVKALREQVRRAGMDRAYAWVNNQQDWPDVYGAGPETLFGIFGTTWYWALSLAGRQRIQRAPTRRPTPATASRSPAMCSTTATWPRASCCARSSG